MQIIFMVYYINVDGYSIQRAKQVIAEFIEAFKMDENPEGVKIIQQFIPIKGQPTRLEIIK